MKFTATAAAALLIVSVSASPAHAFPGAASSANTESAVPAPMSADPVSGTVVETMDAGGYTYVCLEDEGSKTWVAVPKMKVKVGEKHAFLPGNVMPGFRSDSLNRTFDTIIFSPGPAILPGTRAEKKSAPQSAVNKVEKASGGDAKTVADCYDDSAGLNTKTVAVRGKVVKVSKRIMGKNWVHLQDGTGDPAKGTHNLVVTTMDEPGVDEVVTATGILAKDRDFGYGYKYDVIVEDATIKK